MMPCLLRISEEIDSYSPMEMNVANYILEHPNEIPSLSIEELSTACNTSVSSVVRLCKAAGYSGYKELLRVLATDIAMQQSRNITYDNIHLGSSLQTTVMDVARNNIQTIESTLAVLDQNELQRAVDSLTSANRIDFYGVGASGYLALDATSKFIRMGKVSMSSNDPHHQISSYLSLKEGDVAVLLSYSGASDEMVELAGLIPQTKATTISITRYSKNKLSTLTNIHLHCSNNEQLVRIGAMRSRIGLMTVVDILYTATANSLYNEVKPYLDKTQISFEKKHSFESSL